MQKKRLERLSLSGTNKSHPVREGHMTRLMSSLSNSLTSMCPHNDPVILYMSTWTCIYNYMYIVWKLASLLMFVFVFLVLFLFLLLVICSPFLVLVRIRAQRALAGGPRKYGFGAGGHNIWPLMTGARSLEVGGWYFEQEGFDHSITGAWAVIDAIKVKEELTADAEEWEIAFLNMVNDD